MWFPPVGKQRVSGELLFRQPQLDSAVNQRDVTLLHCDRFG